MYTKKSDLITEQNNPELYRLLNKVPRMYWQAAVPHPCNYLKGLYDLIEDNLTNQTVMVEIGSFAAVSSHLFAKKVKHINCVDMWAPYPEIEESYIVEGERLFDIFSRTVTNATKIKESSTEAAKRFKDKSLDFVYVDAFHTYDACLEDINTWLPKIKENGSIGGHDIHMTDVRRAVEEALPGKVIKTYDDCSWFVDLND
jgi:predicted O-methyltransferase YrrM